MSTIDLLNVTTLPLKQLMRRRTHTGNQYSVNSSKRNQPF